MIREDLVKGFLDGKRVVEIEEYFERKKQNLPRVSALSYKDLEMLADFILDDILSQKYNKENFILSYNQVKNRKRKEVYSKRGYFEYVNTLIKNWHLKYTPKYELKDD